MSDLEDAELTQALEALVAVKEREQLRAKLWFSLALVLFLAATLFHHHGWLALGSVILSIAALVLGVRHHLRASALRNQAMEKILAEAFRRAGQDGSKVDA